jgi:hypothetical protein
VDKPARRRLRGVTVVQNVVNPSHQPLARRPPKRLPSMR